MDQLAEAQNYYYLTLIHFAILAVMIRTFMFISNYNAIIAVPLIIAIITRIVEFFLRTISPLFIIDPLIYYALSETTRISLFCTFLAKMMSGYPVIDKLIPIISLMPSIGFLATYMITDSGSRILVLVIDMVVILLLSLMISTTMIFLKVYKNRLSNNDDQDQEYNNCINTKNIVWTLGSYFVLIAFLFLGSIMELHNNPEYYWMISMTTIAPMVPFIYSVIMKDI